MGLGRGECERVRERMYDVRRIFKKVKEINKFPSMYRDLALVVDHNISAQEILDIVKKTGKRMLMDAYVFDLYVGENVEDDKKNNMKIELILFIIE